MRLSKSSAKVPCIVLVIILMLWYKPFSAFPYEKTDFKNIHSCAINDNSSIINSSLSIEKDLTYSKDLLSFFPQKENNQLFFHGYAEYAHFLTVNKIDFDTSKVNITLDGSIMDGYNLGERQLDIKYVVNNNSVNEYIIVNHEDESKDNVLNSIIPNQTILKLPLEALNSWKQKFSYQGAEYEATTTITSFKTTNNLRQCTTTTIVNNIDGYLNDTYTEERTYEEGKGLILFSVSTPLDGSFPYIVFENNTFSYILDKFIEKE